MSSDKIVADLDTSKRVKLANSVLCESPKLKILRLPTFNATDIRNIDLPPLLEQKPERYAGG